jgi:dolichol-phosphate mannosyltransferase
MLRLLRSVALKALGREKPDFVTRLPRFVVVGATGTGVNEAILFLLHGILGVALLGALLPAIEASILWNFQWNDRWTFQGRRIRSSRLRRIGSYHAVRAAGVAVNVGVFALLAVGFGINYLVSNLIAIVLAGLSNWGGSALWTWAGH